MNCSYFKKLIIQVLNGKIWYMKNKLIIQVLIEGPSFKYISFEHEKRNL